MSKRPTQEGGGNCLDVLARSQKKNLSQKTQTDIVRQDEN